MGNRKSWADRKRKLVRKAATRPPYDRVLIVCEGEKTERQYFKDIGKHYQLSNNIEIVGTRGKPPQQVVKYAAKKLEDKQYDFERVYCVFDRDEHPEFKNALYSAQKINKKLDKKSIQFKAIPSNPCFEIWFLLHFESLTDKEITSRNLQKKLKKKYLPNYEKNAEGVFEKLGDKLNDALENCKKLRTKMDQELKNSKKLSKNTTERDWLQFDYMDKNPYTAVDEVVEYLSKLGEQQKTRTGVS